MVCTNFGRQPAPEQLGNNNASAPFVPPGSRAGASQLGDVGSAASSFGIISGTHNKDSHARVTYLLGNVHARDHAAAIHVQLYNTGTFDRSREQKKRPPKTGIRGYAAVG